MNDLDWNLVRTFAAVAQTGSLTAAATRLGSNQPTVGRHLRALEDLLGVPLVLRHARGVRLTPEGEALLASAQAVEGRMQAFVRRAQGARERPQGVVRITASEMFGLKVVLPLLAELRAAWPEIALELVLDDQPTDLLQGAADVAVRMFRPTQQDLVARRVGAVRLGLFAHADYLARRGVPADFADLARHDTVGYDRLAPQSAAMARIHPQLGSARCALRTDSAAGQLDAVIAGVGVGVLQCAIAARVPGLVQLLAQVPLPADAPMPELPVWITAHRDARARPAVAAVFEALAEHLARHCALDAQGTQGTNTPQPAVLLDEMTTTTIGGH